jgi:hypothetical protein
VAASIGRGHGACGAHGFFRLADTRLQVIEVKFFLLGFELKRLRRAVDLIGLKAIAAMAVGRSQGTAGGALGAIFGKYAQRT